MSNFTVDGKVLTKNIDKKKIILEDIESFRNNCLDKETNLRSIIHAGPLGFIEIVDKTRNKLEVSGHAESQLLAKLGIPGTYIHRCSPKLQAANVNSWIKRIKDKQVLIRLYNNKVRAIFSTRYNLDMDDYKTIPFVLNVLESSQDIDFKSDEDLEDLHIQHFIKAEDLTILTAYYRSLTVEHDGESYRAGVQLVNSEVGKSSLWLKPSIRGGNKIHGIFNFIDRSVEGSTSLKHVGEFKAEAIQEAVNKAKTAAQMGISRLLETSGEIIQNPLDEIKRFATESEFISHRVTTALEEEYKLVEGVSKLNLARSILRAVESLPIYQKYLAEAEVGRYLNLFSDLEARTKQLIIEGE